MKKYNVKKEWNKYIKECLDRGYNLEQIKGILISHGYNKKIVKKLINEYEKDALKQELTTKGVFLFFTLSLIIFLFVGLVFLKPTITGLTTVTKEVSYNESLYLVFNESSEYVWLLENIGELKSLKLSGSLSRDALAKVFIEHNNITYLIFDSTLTESGLFGITGLVVLNETIINETESLENISIINETINETNPSIINESLENQTTINETNQSFINKTELIINKSIDIILKYKENSSYDADNDGIETLTGVVDFNVDAKFNWNVSYDRLCTKWEVYNQEESTIVCYGSKDCCSLLELVPERTDWNETFYLNYGKYGAGYNNKVTAQVIYANYSLVIPYSDIAYSDYDSLTAKFLPAAVEFNDLCIDTCLLTGFNSSSYKLIINVTNGTLSLTTISYSILEEAVNKAPYLVKNISTVNINKNENITVDLSEYFTDPDNDELSYSYYGVENITVLIEDNIAVIVPDKGFTGRRYSYFIANDSSLIAVSDVFAVDIVEKEIEGLEQLKAEINKPVKWVKRSKNLTITIPDYAFNLSVNKIINNEKSSLEKNKIKIKHKGKLKGLDEFEIEKKLEKLLEKEKKKEEIQKQIDELLQLKSAYVSEEITDNETTVIVNETADFFEVGYETAAPITLEENISYYNKKIIISSEINYTNVLAYTDIIESPRDTIKLYWYIDGVKTDVTNNDTINLTFVDSDEDNLIERLEWIVPHLSNQTFEVEITILNVQSYPTVGGNWIVRFNTSGVGNLTITAVNGTSYSEMYDDNSSNVDDLELLSLKCGNYVLFNKYDLINEDNVYLSLENNSLIKINKSINKSIKIKSIKIINYNCSSIGYHTVKVLTEGVHTQEFEFGGQKAYAKNLARYGGTDKIIHTTYFDFNQGNNTNTTINATGEVLMVVIGELPNSGNFKNGINMSSNVLLMHFNNDSSVGEAYNGTNAIVYDYSGKGHNGTCYGNCTLNETDGKFGNAFEFDGLGDYIDLGTTQFINTGTPFTVAVWAYLRGWNTYPAMFTTKSDGDSGGVWRVFFSKTSYGPIGFGSASSWDQLKSNDIPVGSLTNKWYHVVVTYNGQGSTTAANFKLFVDGIQRSLTNGPGFGNYVINSQIGATRPHNSLHDWNGTIDEVAIYNRSLSAEEIKTLYLRGVNNTHGEYTSPVIDVGRNANWTEIKWAKTDTNATPRVSELDYDKYMVLWMHFNNDSSIGENNTLVYDWSGQGNNGTCSGTTCPVYNDSGRFSKAMEFDGSDDYITLNKALFSTTDPSIPYSVSAWVKTTDSEGRDGGIVTQYTAGPAERFGLRVSSGNLCYWKGDCYATSTKLINDSVWHHVAFTKDSSQIRLYVDGVADGSGTDSLNFTNTNTWIGGFGTSTDEFDGLIEEVAIWNRSLSAEEIRQMYWEDRIRFQVRSCDDAGCSGEVWQGNYTVYDNSILSTSANRYFQYKAQFRSNSTVTPVLEEVNITYVMSTAEGGYGETETMLTIWDSSDLATTYANYTVIYANYTNTTSDTSINGSNVWCEFRHNKTGLNWSQYSAINMTFNPNTLQYELIADGKYIANHTSTMPIDRYHFNISCYNEFGYANLSGTDDITISNYSTGLAIQNDTGKKINEQVMFYANYSRNNSWAVKGWTWGQEIGQVVWNTSDLGDGYSIAFADLDNDGEKDEIVLSVRSGSNVLYGFYSNGTQKFGGSGAYSYPYEVEVFDADNDTYQNEIITTSYDHLEVFNETGNQVWSSSSLGVVVTVTTGDLDHDGIKNDIAVGTNNGILVYNSTDGLNWSIKFNISNSNTVWEVFFTDADRDGFEDDIVAIEGSASISRALVFNETGNLTWNTTDLGDSGYSIATVDLDHDGYRDEVIVADGGDLYAFEFNGSYDVEYQASDGIWSQSDPVSVIDEIVIADLDGDGYDDDFVIGEAGSGDNGWVRAYNNDSTSLWNYTVSGSGGGGNYIYSISIGDINNDGEIEIVLADIDFDTIHIINRTGSLLWKYEIGLGDIGSDRGSSPATDISDINNDGILDIAVSSLNGFAHLLQDLTCKIAFDDGVEANMTWDYALDKWNYSRTFSSAGTKNYNITCEKKGYETQLQQASVRILATPVINYNATIPATPVYYQNVTITANVTDADDNIIWVNFTLTDPSGTDVINHTNGTKSGDLWNSSSYNLTTEGTWKWLINVSDADALITSSNSSFIIDITKPSITLNEPIENYNTTSTDVMFNWTAIDNVYTTLMCNLTIDSLVNESWVTVTNNTAYNITVTGFLEGTYLWNVTCWDNSTNINTNTSVTRTFAKYATPVLTFTSPTETDGASIARNWAIVNMTIDLGSTVNLDNFTFEWNATNYTIYDNSLVVAMNFNNNSAIGENNTYVVDISKYGNNGTCSGTTCPVYNLTNKKFGAAAMQFDGSDDRISIPYNGSLNVQKELTMSAWIKTTKTTRNPIFRRYNSASPYNGYALIMAPSYGGCGTNGVIGAWFGSGTYVCSTGTANDGNWHYIVGTYNGSLGSVYIDGSLDNSGVRTNGLNNAVTGLTIGMDEQPQYFNGLIDEVAIYNRSLSADEILFRYQSEFQKYNSTQYRFYNNITNRTDGNYNYYGWAKDTVRNNNKSETRTVTIDTTPSEISFTAPTLTTGTTIAKNYVEVNVSITESSLGVVKFNWDGSNYTIFNDSLVLMYNFDNVSALGESNSIVYDVSGNGNNGTVYGATWTADGKHRGAYSFDGIDDVINATNKGFNTSTGTISAWFKPATAGNDGKNYTIISTPSEISNKDSGLVLLMHFNNDSSVGENNTLVYDWSGHCYDNETQILTENGWKYFYELNGSEDVLTLNPETHEKEWQKPIAYQEFDYDKDMFKIVLEDGSDLLVSDKHKVYSNQIKPLRNNLTKSDVVNTLTSDCFLRCGSLDQIEALIDIADARKSASLGSDNNFADSSRNFSYAETLMNLIDSSTSFCLISNSCSESLDLNKHSSLYFFNSDLINSGAENFDIMDENKYEVIDLGFIIEKNILLSITNIILNQSNEVPFSARTFNNFSLVSGDTSESSFLNLPFLAFLPSPTDHLINSCSSLECSFFNNISPIFFLLINSSLANSDQFTQANLDISDFSFGSNANVILAIYITPLDFNSSNLLSSLTLRDITLRTTSATLISGNSSLKLFNSSSGTDTVILGILSTSNNYFNTSKDVDIYKHFGLDGFKLQLITDVYAGIKEGKKVYFLDSNNNPVKVKSIVKEQYKGKIYDVDVENDIVLVRRNSASQNYKASPQVAQLRCVSHPDNEYGCEELITSGGIWSGNSNNGTCSGTSCPIYNDSGKFSKAMQFDGSNDHVDLGTSFDVTSPTTFAAWVYPRDRTDYYTIFAKRDSAVSTNMRIHLLLDVTTGNVWIYSQADSDKFSAAPPVNTWTHVAVIVDDIDSYVYLNGELEDNIGNAFTWGSDATAVARVGRVGDNDDEFKGLIDEVAIYNRSLSAAEIRDLYLGGLSLHKDSSNRLRYHIGNTTLTYGISSWSANQWHHIAGTYSEPNANLYVDGSNVNSTTGFYHVDRFGNFTYFGNDEKNGTDMNGTLDEVRVWDISLSTDEIQEQYYSSLNKYDTNKWALYVNQSNLSDAIYLYQAFTFDSLGNTNQTEERNITVDTTKPSITLKGPIDNYNTTSANIEFNWTATDNLDKSLSCNLTINGTVNQSYIDSTNGSNTNITVAGFNDGNYYWNVTCLDNGSNTNISTTRTFIKDATPPVISLDLPINDTWQQEGNVTFKYTATDPREIHTCILYGNFNGSWEANKTNSSVSSGVQDTFNLNLTNGSYIWNVWCNDTLGNSGYNATNFTVYVDTILPTIELKGPIDNYNTSSSDVEFNWTATDNLDKSLSCNLTINGTVNQSYIDSTNGSNTNITVTGFNEGTYYWNVTCIDNATNINISITRTFSRDITNPDVALISPANYTWSGSGYTFTATYKPYDLRLDTCILYHNYNAAWEANETDNNPTNNAENTLSIEVNESIDNEFLWNVWCNDTVGNSAFNETNFTARIDTDIPTKFELVEPTNNTVSTNLTPLLNWTETTDANFKNYTIEVDNNINFTSINYTYTITNITNTSYQANISTDTTWYWRVIAYDLAGNNYTTNYSVYITDTTNPSITLTSPANYTWSGSGYTFTATYKPYDVNLDSCILYHNYDTTWGANETDNPTNNASNTLSIEVNESVDNEFLWNVWCNDSAGNFAFNETNFTVRIDTAIPSTFDLLEPSNNTVSINLTPLFNWSETTEGNFKNYTIEISDNINFTSTNYTYSTVGNITNTSYYNNSNITTDTTWYWHVIAYDLADNNWTTYYYVYTTDTLKPNFTLINITPNPAEFYYENVSVNWTVNELHLDTTISNVTYPNGSLVGSFTTNYTLTGDNLTVLGNYTITFWANDSAGNSNSTSEILTIHDTTAPSEFDLTSPADDTKSYDSTPLLNWSATTEVLFKNYTILLSTSSSFNYINLTYYTNTTVTNNSYQLVQSLAANTNWSWRVIAYDTSNNYRTSTSTFRYEVIENTPPTAVNLTLPLNATKQIYNRVNFNWTIATDANNDNVTYELIIANDTAFTEIDVNVTSITTAYYETEGTGNDLTEGRKYWRVRASDGTNYSDYSNYNYFDSIYAIINITSPLNDTVVYPANVTEITVKEVAGANWINNLTLTIMGINYTAVNAPNWEYNYTIPNVHARLFNITAIGYNLTTNATITDYITLKLLKIAPSVPIINYVCSNETYILNNTNATLIIKATLDTLINYTNLTITTPSNLNETLTADSSSESNLVYYYYYPYFINETGNYTLQAGVTDVANQTTKLNYTFYSVIGTKTVTLNSNNVTTININDICTGNPVRSGATFTIPVDAFYNVELKTEKPIITFLNSNLTGTIDILNYTETGAVTAPSNKRKVFEFEVKTNFTQYSKAKISYNYSSAESAISDEDNLVMYKCSSVDSCTWTLLGTSLDTGTNIVYTNQTTLSVFLVAEPLQTTTETVTTTTTTTVSGGGGGAVKKLVSLELIAPSPLSIYTSDKTTTPIFLRNKGEIVLNKIYLIAKTNSSDLSLELSKDYFERLNVDQKEKTELIIISHSKPGRYEITVLANVTEPAFSDSVKIYIDLLERGAENKTLVEIRVVFAKDLFKENPECLEMYELIEQAETALENEEFEKARLLTEAAINGCKDLVTSLGKELVMPSQKPKIKFDLRLALILITILMSMIILVSVLRKRPMVGRSRKKPKSKETEGFISKKTKKPRLSFFKKIKKQTAKKKLSREEKIKRLWKKR